MLACLKLIHRTRNLQTTSYNKLVKTKTMSKKVVDHNLGGPLCFYSRSKTPNDKFSNFYEVKIKMAEGRFNSVEHYFQAMKFIDENHSRFEINGDLGRQRINTGKTLKPTVSKGRFIKSAGSKSGTKKYRLTLRSNGLDRERAKQKMKQGLHEKFKKEPFKTLLLQTLNRPLVHIPVRGATDYWTARVKKTSGDIEGENNMGKLLMEVRKELQEASTGDFGGKKRKRDEGYGAEMQGSENEIDSEDKTCEAEDIEGPQVKRGKHSDSGDEGEGEETNKEKTMIGILS